MQLRSLNQTLIIVFMISLFQPISTYIFHSYTYHSIPYAAGLFHIHSPMHFMEAHGFALPGFKITDTCAPQWIGNYVVTEFNFTTHFGPMTAKVFSGTPDTSHILVRDCSGSPCILGRLKVQKLSASGHIIHARGDLLRPASVWEQLIGGQKLVKRDEVEQAIKLGYIDFKNDMNLMLYANLVINSIK
jgi:hypothetical protein